MNHKIITVTQPTLPPLEDFMPYLKEIWGSKWLTNGGPFHQKLEAALVERLDVSEVALVSNGTIGLMVALQALSIEGEVITTPYSFVATAHSLLWNNLTPVFVDIDPVTCNLDPFKIEAAITSRTSAILPVHCYGTPCDVDAIQRIADRNGLKVIYDAAHAFDVRDKGKSLLRAGDLSVLSFHATKVFNTFEGGAIICPNAQTKRRIDFLKNFGFADEVTVTEPGINGKMNEIQAAFGILQLKILDDAIAARARIAARYVRDLDGIPGLTCLAATPDVAPNHSYFPILIGPNYRLSRDELYNDLRSDGILSRRYFYPLISNMPMYKKLPSAARENLPVANRIAEEVLCLPIFPTLAEDDQARIIAIVAGRV
jgi:dTDP-4-amino-4,6-dideoxygalactose transaminase